MDVAIGNGPNSPWGGTMLEVWFRFGGRRIGGRKDRCYEHSDGKSVDFFSLS